ncbi:MAG: tyrosine recombinase XerC [Candidatus Marinimicrobia bacterium]|nr:tyrosine recombinase XerC [Candidatus Neomarinimicrobiota bacterium]
MRDLKLDFVEEYLKYLDKERHYSFNSIKSYRIDLNQFCQFLNQYLGKIVDDFRFVDKTSIKHFLSYLFDRDISSRSIARKLATVKSFFRYLVKSEEVPFSPAAGVKSPKFVKHLPDFLEENLIEKLMQAPLLNKWEGLRDRAIMELFYSTGMRLNELVNLSVGDVSQSENLVKVTGKGNKERLVPVGDTAIDAINEYLYIRERAAGAISDNDPLFISNRMKRISPRTIQIRLKKYFEEIAMGMKFNPHLLRHSFATHLLDRGADIRAVKDLLGHASLSSTQVYTHLKVEQMKKIYKQSHPHA